MRLGRVFSKSTSQCLCLWRSLPFPFQPSFLHLREGGFGLCRLEIFTGNQYHLPHVCPAKKGLQILHTNRGPGISHKQGAKCF